MSIKKEDRRIKFTKMFLKSSLVDLLETKSISKITIKEICENADINRATFYAHYADQYDLLHQIEDEYIERILKDISLKNRNQQDSVLVIKDILEFILANAKTSKILLNNRGDIQFQKRIMALVHIGIINQLKSENFENVITAEYMFSYVIAGCVGILEKWFELGLEQSPKELAEIINQLTEVTLSLLDKK